MLINLRNALMAGKRLPYDAEVEYLQSSGTQYINTGIKPGPNTRVEITFAMTTFTANCGLFGARGSAAANNASYNLFIISNSGARVRYDWSGSGQYQTTEAETSTDATYVLGAAGGTITRNGSTVMSVSASKAAINYPLYVFNFNNVGTPYSTGANARFWSVKIYDGQTLVFDAIPVRKGTVGYLYDRVSGKLFGNAGTGDFVLGPDVVPVEYIESHGTEYINAGFATSGNGLRVRLACEKTTSATSEMAVVGRNAGNGFELYFSGGQCGLWNNTGKHVISDVPIVQGTKYSIDASINSSGASLTVNGSEKASSFAPYDTSAVDVLMFRHFTKYYFVGRAYSCEMWNNDVLTRRYYPVRVGTEGAMMDVLTRRIYRNAGTGAFTYGNDLKYPIPAA